MKGTEAMDHVRDEMAKAKDGYTSYMGEMLSTWLLQHTEAELDGEKTLAGAFAALKDAARRKAKGGCYAMPPDEIFAGMMEYYGIQADRDDYAKCMMAMLEPGEKAPSAEPVDAKKAHALVLDLDALLEG